MPQRRVSEPGGEGEERNVHPSAVRMKNPFVRKNSGNVYRLSNAVRYVSQA